MILNLRQIEHTSELDNKIQDIGVQIINIPMLDVKRINFESGKIDNNKIIVFTSRNAVDCSYCQVKLTSQNIIYAMGPGTQEQIFKIYNLKSRIINSKPYTSSALFSEIEVKHPNSTVMVFTGTNPIISISNYAKLSFEIIKTYERVRPDIDGNKLCENISKVNGILVTSTDMFNHFKYYVDKFNLSFLKKFITPSSRITAHILEYYPMADIYQSASMSDEDILITVGKIYDK